jgi:hypothetical protein
MAKVFIKLTKDADGYPPFEVESVWAVKVAEELYRLDNIPFYAYQATFGDVVRAVEEEGNPWFVERHSASGNSLLRVIVFAGHDSEPLRKSLRELGCDNEQAWPGGLIAVNVPQETRLDDVRAILDAGLEEGWLEYEEAILRH